MSGNKTVKNTDNTDGYVSIKSLRAHAFAVELQKIHLGKIHHEIDNINGKMALKIGLHAPSTYGRWLTGENLPNKDIWPYLEKTYPDAFQRWLYPTPDNRWTRHWTALDFKTLLFTKGEKTVKSQAMLFLNEIANDWRPQDGCIKLKGPKPRGGVSYKYKYIKSTKGLSRQLINDERQEITIGFKLEAKGALLLNPSLETAKIFEPEYPQSIIPYMLAYAAESGLPDPGLKDAFVFDLLTAVICASTLRFLNGHVDIFNRSNLHYTFLSCHEFFWSDLDWNNADEDQSSAPYEVLNTPVMSYIYPLLRRHNHDLVDPDSGDHLEFVHACHSNILTSKGKVLAQDMKALVYPLLGKNCNLFVFEELVEIYYSHFQPIWQSRECLQEILNDNLIDPNGLNVRPIILKN